VAVVRNRAGRCKDRQYCDKDLGYGCYHFSIRSSIDGSARTTGCSSSTTPASTVS